VSSESFQFPFIVFWRHISAKWLEKINSETELWKYTTLAQAGIKDRRWITYSIQYLHCYEY